MVKSVNETLHCMPWILDEFKLKLYINILQDISSAVCAQCSFGEWIVYLLRTTKRQLSPRFLSTCIPGGKFSIFRMKKYKERIEERRKKKDDGGRLLWNGEEPKKKKMYPTCHFQMEILENDRPNNGVKLFSSNAWRHSTNKGRVKIQWNGNTELYVNECHGFVSFMFLFFFFCSHRNEIHAAVHRINTAYQIPDNSIDK